MFVRAAQRGKTGLTSVCRFSTQAEVASLHALALKMNATKHKEEKQEWIRKRNVPGLDVPEALKLRPQDSMELKKWKYRQQQRYEDEHKFDYLNDQFIRMGVSKAEDVAEQRAKMQELRDWAPPLTGRQISLEKLKHIQENFNPDPQLMIDENDSEMDKKEKAQQQLERYIAATREELDQLGDPEEDLKSFKTDMKEVQADQDEIELKIMDYETELENVKLPDGINSLSEFNKHILDIQKDINKHPKSATSELKAEALSELGLIRNHAIRDYDQELERAQELEDNCTDEFEARFGHLPAESSAVPSWEEWDEAKPVDMHTWKHLEKLDYSKFVKAPTELEVHIMDRFAKKDERFDAEMNNVTLHSRIPVPNGPYDKGPFARALHLFRIQAIRNYIFDMQKKRDYEKEFGYRDLEDLGLVMDDPEYPWKNEIFEEHKLALKNNYYWTQGQKEQYLVKLHETLRGEIFSKENIDKGLV